MAANIYTPSNAPCLAFGKRSYQGAMFHLHGGFRECIRLGFFQICHKFEFRLFFPTKGVSCFWLAVVAAVDDYQVGRDQVRHCSSSSGDYFWVEVLCCQIPGWKAQVRAEILLSPCALAREANLASKILAHRICLTSKRLALGNARGELLRMIIYTTCRLKATQDKLCQLCFSHCEVSPDPGAQRAAR